MSQVIYVILVVFMAAMIYKNIKLIRRSKHTKAYVECTNSIFNNDSNVNKQINDYIESEDSSEFKHKGRIIKVYAELKYGLDTSSNLSFIDLKDLIYTKDKVDIAKMDLNSDSFYWMIMNLILAHLNKDEETITKLNAVMAKYHDDINNDLVIALYDNVDLAFKGDAEGVKFLEDLLKGEYSGYRYDKRMIGMYKNVALAILAYFKHDLETEDKEDLTHFAEMKAGKLLLSNFGLLSEYEGKTYSYDDEEETTEEEVEDGDK